KRRRSTRWPSIGGGAFEPPSAGVGERKAISVGQRRYRTGVCSCIRLCCDRQQLSPLRLLRPSERLEGLRRVDVVEIDLAEVVAIGREPKIDLAHGLPGGRVPAGSVAADVDVLGLGDHSEDLVGETKEHRAA